MAKNNITTRANANDPNQESINRGLGSQNEDLQQNIASGDQRTNLQDNENGSDYDEDLDIRYNRTNHLRTAADTGNEEEGSPSGRSGSNSGQKSAGKLR